MKAKRLFAAIGILTVLLTVCRIVMLPVAAGDGHTLTKVYYPLLAAVIIAVLALLAVGRTAAVIPPLSGNASKWMAVSGIAFGAGMAATSAWDLVNWLKNGIRPAPGAAEIIEAADDVLLGIVSLCGIVGGIFLISYFVGWRQQPYAPFRAPIVAVIGEAGALSGIAVIILAIYGRRMRGGSVVVFLIEILVGLALIVAFLYWQFRKEHTADWLWLLPSLWMFARLVRYDILYATTVEMAPAVYEFVLYSAALVFLLKAARYMCNMNASGKYLRGLGAAVAALAFSALLSRGILMIMGQTVAAAYCPLPNFADFTLGIFGLGTACALHVDPKDTL